ncbi:MAG: hypothetical protein C5B54_02160, partial [Acidobacteria bacterium]
MNKQITILAFLFNCSIIWSQKVIKIATPCTEEFLQSVPGRWIRPGDGLHANISKQQQQEIFNRLDKVHQFVFDIYPSPLGVDAVQTRFTTDEKFAYQVKFDQLPDGNTSENFVNGVPVVFYSYTAFFCKYECGRDKYEMMPGYPSESGEQVTVVANSLSFLPRSSGGPYEMNIGGIEIRMMPVVKGTWKGYTLYTPQGGSGVTWVLLHRQGMFPYTPVTRKQYLDLCISYFNKDYDKQLASIDATAKAFIDGGMNTAQGIKEQKEALQKQKKEVLKHYQDGLAATTAAGLSDAPAIIPLTMCDMDPRSPIFTTQAAGGRMLVTENP